MNDSRAALRWLLVCFSLPLLARSAATGATATEGGSVSVSGHVLDSSGKPLEGAVIRLFASDDEGALPAGEAATTPDGRFSLPLAGGGHSFIAVAQAHGLAPGCLLVDPAAPQGIEFNLASGGAVTGCFRESATGAPAKGVAVALDGKTPELAACLRVIGDTNRSVTNQEGKIRWKDLPTGAYRLAVIDERFLEISGIELELPPSESRALDCLSFHRAGAISGRLVDPLGHVPAPKEIRVFKAGGTKDPVATVRSEETGSFRVPRLDPQLKYHLVVRGPECLDIARREVKAGGTPVTITTSSGLSLIVEAKDQGTGRPLAEYQIASVPAAFPHDREAGPEEMACLPQKHVKDPSGRVVLAGLASGQHLLAVSSAGYGSARLAVRVPAEAASPAVVSLSRDGCRWIRLVDSKTGTPVDGAQIASEQEIFEDPQARELVPLMTSDAGGRFSFCPAYPGDRDFIVHQKLYAPRKVVLGKLETNAIQDVALTEGGSVAGKVVEREGSPESGVLVSARQLGTVFEAITDAEGRFILERIAPGSISIARAGSSGGDAVTRTARVEEGKTVTLDFGTEDEETVQILEADRPVSNARVIVRSTSAGDEGSARTMTDAEGRLRFSRKKGTEPVAAIEHQGDWVFLRLSVTESKEPATLRLPARKFVGRVLDGTRRPLRDAALVTQEGGSARKEPNPDSGDPGVWLTANGCVSVSDSQGHFELLIPSKARYISVFLPRGLPRNLPLPEGDTGDLVLAERGRLRGHVNGVEGPVSVGEVNSGMNTFAVMTGTAGDGTFDLQDLDQKPFALVLWAPDLAPYIEPGIIVRPGEEIERAVSLTPGGRLRVVFKHAGGPDAIRSPGFISFSGLDVGWILGEAAPPSVTPREGGGEVAYPHLGPGIYHIGCGEKGKEIRVNEGADSTIECP